MSDIKSKKTMGGSLFEIVLGIITFSVATYLGIIIISKDRKSWTNRLFLLLSILIDVYIIVNYLSLHPPTDTAEAQLFWIRVVMFVTSFIGPALFLFVHTFPYSRIRLKKKYIFSLGVLMVTSASFSLSNLVFSGITYPDGQPVPTPGAGIPVFMIDFAGLFILSFILLILRYRKSSGLPKQQLRYLLLGVILTFSLMAITTVIFVVILKTSATVFLGPLVSVILMIAIAYAIVKYKFLDIRSLVSRSVIFALLVFLITIFFVASTYLLSLAFVTESLFSEAIIFGIVSLVVVVAIEPLRRMLALFTNKIFFKAAIDYPAATKAITTVINDEIELDKLVKRLSSEIEMQLRIEHATILLPVGQNIFMAPDELEHATNKPASKKKGSPYNNSPLIKYATKNQDDLVIIDELDHRVADARTDRERKYYDKIRQDVEAMNAYAIVPIPSAHKTKGLAGMVVLSRKRSGDGLSIQDIQLLEVVAPQVSSAIQKSLLYQESQQFNMKLQREVEKATKELRGANEKLMELDRAKSEFMSIASHQLRTPLAGILGYLSMIEGGDFGKMTKEQQPIIHDVVGATQRLIRLVNLFLNVTRIEAGRFVMNYTKQPFYDVLLDIYKELKPTADKKGVKLTIDKDLDLPEAEIDADKLKDVIINLTDNAIKYSPEGHVHMTAEANSRTLHVMIKDSGVGIPKEEVDNLFNKFVRGSGIARVEPNGSGLGLFIAKKIVEGHGGEIWAASEGEGKGSTFQFKIPLKADKEAKKKAEEFKKRAKK